MDSSKKHSPHMNENVDQTDLYQVKGLNKARINILMDAGFADQESIRKNPKKFFDVVSANAKQFVVHHHDPEKIIMQLFDLNDLGALELYHKATKVLPYKLWTLPQSVFSIVSLSARPYLCSLGVDPRKMEVAQGALLQHHIFRIRHLEKKDRKLLNEVLKPYMVQH